MKKVLIMLSLLALGAASSYGYGISWGADANYIYESNGSTMLTGGADGSVGCFVQLLWVGANGTRDQAYYGVGIDGVGTTDDVVVDKRWIGAGLASGGDGWFSGGLVLDSAQVGGNADVQTGRSFFARAWEDPASDYASGFVPSSAVNYGNSATWVFPNIEVTGDEFDVSATPFNTTLAAMPIPEPTVTALLFAGFLGISLFRRARK